MKRNKERALDEIYGSNIARLSGEAPRIVPLAYPTLYKKARDGRLRTFGSPTSVAVDHLLEQYRAGFPKIEESEAA